MPHRWAFAWCWFLCGKRLRVLQCWWCWYGFGGFSSLYNGRFWKGWWRFNNWCYFVYSLGSVTRFDRCWGRGFWGASLLTVQYLTSFCFRLFDCVANSCRWLFHSFFQDSRKRWGSWPQRSTHRNRTLQRKGQSKTVQRHIKGREQGRLLTSVERVLTSKGSFFKSALERTVVIFCNEVVGKFIKNAEWNN